MSGSCYRATDDAIVRGGDQTAQSTCDAVFDEGGVCIANHSARGAPPISDLQLRAGFDLGGPGVKQISLRCWVSNGTGWVGNTTGLGEPQGGPSVACINTLTEGCSVEWGGAFIILFVSLLLWGAITLYYMVRHSKFAARLRREWGLERISLLEGHTWHVDFWRFIVQRDVRTIPEEEKPPDAHVWDPTSRYRPQEAAAPGGAPGPAPDEDTRRRRLGLGRMHFAARRDQSGRRVGMNGMADAAAAPRQLSSTSLMYLPPLTKSLLTSYFESSRLSTKLLSS